jgi:hypothetical protein
MLLDGETQYLAPGVIGCVPGKVVHFGLGGNDAAGPNNPFYALGNAVDLYSQGLPEKDMTIQELNSHTDSRGFLKTPCHCRIAIGGLHQYLNLRSHTAFLAKRRQLKHVNYFWTFPQSLQAYRQVFGRLVVDFERQLRHSIGGEFSGRI